MEAFCERHLMEQSLEDWSSLPAPSQAFLQNLGLPSLHPFCNASSNALLHPAAPDMGPAVVPVDNNAAELLTTSWYYYVEPASSAFSIWLYFFSAYIAPVGFILCCWFEQEKVPVLDQIPLLPVVTLITAWILMTDDSHVLEFGRLYGMTLLIATLIVLRPRRRHSILLLAVVVSCIFLSPWQAEDPQTCQIEPGIYFNSDNPLINNLVSLWNETGLPDYAKVATPWQWTGDARSGIPYYMNAIDQHIINFHRVWLATEDDEYVALDIAFPKEGHDWDKPLYLVFHGLNGGSNEGYVKDFAHSRLAEGSTVVVMIARGLADTPIQGFTIYHGARTIDAHSAATILRDRVKAEGQTLAGVGYSLGAIVLNNYVSSYGENVALDVGVSISGALDCNFQRNFVRSKRLWQSMIVAHMKDTYFGPKWGHRISHQLGRESYQRLMRARNIVEADEYIGTLYNGYDNQTEFYSDMSTIVVGPNGGSRDRHVAIPLLILYAMDDPLSSWQVNVANDPESPLYPSRLVRQEKMKNLVVLLTKKGGHVGWPTGWFPHNWEFMNTVVAQGFVSAFDSSIRGKTGEKDSIGHDHPS